MPLTPFAVPILILVGAVASDSPHIEHVGLVAPHILGITVTTGTVEYGRQIPYAQQPGDTLEDPEHHRWVKRDGRVIGSLVGAGGDQIYTLDHVLGAKLDTDRLDQPTSYHIASQEDPTYGQGKTPIAVHRKSKPTDFGRVGPWHFDAPMQHTLYLSLPHPLAEGKQYTITVADGLIPLHTFRYAPTEMRSEAVHVSQLGFRPDDPAKVGFLSCWLGNGGPVSYEEDRHFQVLEHDTGQVVFEGNVVLSKAADDRTEDAYESNYNGVDVYEMDFTPLHQPGTYRIYVEGIGCSYPFMIDAEAWRKAFTVSARGFYHQRSGIELGPPYTTFERPRALHPEDGLEVLASTTALMDTGNGLAQEDTNFGNLVAGRTEQPIPDAWGGYMDAGDWDRRIQHLVVSRLLLELAEIFPAYFAELPLNIPESNDGLPDIVSEALFNLDGYRRMQTDQGGIRGGIESAEHPRHGEGSWQESLPVYAYAPGVWSSYVYAGVAARAAHWLNAHAPSRAGVYQGSAVRAMLWAEKLLPERASKPDPHAVRDARNLAAVELYRLTGGKEWHKLFLETTVFHEPDTPLYQWQSHEQRDAAWVYLTMEHRSFDPEVRNHCLNALLKEADERLAGVERSGFRWTKDPWRPAAWGAFSTPDAVSLVRAHAASLDDKYLRAAVLACQTGAGANPLNLCYTTGLGHASPQHPLHIDSRITHQSPPPGLTIFGPRDVARDRDYWIHQWLDRFCMPSVDQWPVIESYWDIFWSPATCEFTVQAPMAANAYVWGYLAARR